MADPKRRKLDRVDFLADFVNAFKNGTHADVIVKSGGDGPGIPAHKAILAFRSKVLGFIFDSDECKTSIEKSITIPDLNYEELKAFLEFFYTGILNAKHIRALYLAADKYDIPYLQDVCRDQIISSLGLVNVFDILELPTIPSDKILMKAATKLVVKNMEAVLNMPRYKEFVLRNLDLSVDITKAFVKDTKLVTPEQFANNYWRAKQQQQQQMAQMGQHRI